METFLIILFIWIIVGLYTLVHCIRFNYEDVRFHTQQRVDFWGSFMLFIVIIFGWPYFIHSMLLSYKEDEPINSPKITQNVPISDAS